LLLGRMLCRRCRLGPSLADAAAENVLAPSVDALLRRWSSFWVDALPPCSRLGPLPCRCFAARAYWPHPRMLYRVNGCSSSGCFTAMVPTDAWLPWLSLTRLHLTAAYLSVESSFIRSNWLGLFGGGLPYRFLAICLCLWDSLVIHGLLINLM
jgi:hypothetical protein